MNAPLRNAISILKHYGPGPHASGSNQDVHGGGGGGDQMAGPETTKTYTVDVVIGMDVHIDNDGTATVVAGRPHLRRVVGELLNEYPDGGRSWLEGSRELRSAAAEAAVAYVGENFQPDGSILKHYVVPWRENPK